MHEFASTGRGRARIRRALTAAALTLAAVVTPLAVSSPASAAYDCTPTTGWHQVGDLNVRVCWTWYWVSGTSIWRPHALYVNTDSTKLYYLRVDTNAWKSPPYVYLEGKKGPASFGVPSEYTWTMLSDVESTTTTIARVIPGRSEPCVGWFRHDRDRLFPYRYTGSC